jgi:3'-phosphoadenosine 5'-phosphosulfate sulfotransferase (PAPS reductase)/FAD synthetase
MEHNHLTHLRELESESIYVIREVAAQFEKPVLLFFRWKRLHCDVLSGQKGFLA